MEEVEDEDEEEDQPKKKRTIKMNEWSMLLRLETGDHAAFDDEEIKHQVYLEAKNIMEQSGLWKLTTNNAKGTDFHLWKKQVK
jgi:hypothetical protein